MQSPQIIPSIDTKRPTMVDESTAPKAAPVPTPAPAPAPASVPTPTPASPPSQPRKVEVVEKPGAKPAPKKASDKNYLKRYVAQSFGTTEERQQRDADQPKDRNKFTLRQFCHENVSQAIPEKTPPPRPPQSERPSTEPKEHKSFMQRIKDAFKRGKGETEEKPAEVPEAEAEGPELQDAK